jgi:hypothetical protein
MTRVALFDFKEVTPVMFHALAPHQQTEMLLLLLERGMSCAAIAYVIGSSSCDVERIAAKKHAVTLGALDQPQSEEVKAAQMAAQNNGVPINAAKALRFFIEEGDGIVVVSVSRLESCADLASDSGEYAVEWLLKNKFLRLVDERKRGRASSYSVTPAGRQMALRLKEGEAA